MEIRTNRESTEISLGKYYCYNYDTMMDACVYLAAKDYWENGSGKEMYLIYSDEETDHFSLRRKRSYQRLLAALNRFKGLSEDEIFNGLKYSCGRTEYKYNKTIETLFELRYMMWN